MKRTNAYLALLLAASMPLTTGCATTYLGGEYRTTAMDIAKKEDKRTLAKGSEWLFFWGLLDSGSFNLQKELRNQLREDEAVTDLEVKDRLSVGGFFLWLITAGIVSHHTLVAKGHPSVINRPVPATGAVREKETIIVPAAPAPAGYPRADRSADYNEGYRDGMKDRGTDLKDRPTRTDRSADYSEGYRDGLKDSGAGAPEGGGH
jgi:hypothetical protein